MVQKEKEKIDFWTAAENATWISNFQNEIQHLDCWVNFWQTFCFVWVQPGADLVYFVPLPDYPVEIFPILIWFLGCCTTMSTAFKSATWQLYSWFYDWNITQLYVSTRIMFIPIEGAIRCGECIRGLMNKERKKVSGTSFLWIYSFQKDSLYNHTNLINPLITIPILGCTWHCNNGHT